MQTAALYIRVSTDDQTEFSPIAQKRLLMEYAKKNNMLVSNEHIYMDEGISGRKAEKRPAFMKMIATAKKKPKPFDVILVHKFDRFSRSREDSIVYKSLLRKECSIQVVSITEHIEDDKFSVILEAMLEAMAEYYSLNLSEEVMKGMTEKALRGEFQSYAPYGYKMVDGKLTIDEEKAETIRMIFDDFLNQDWTCFKIARSLNALGLKTTRGNDFDVRAVEYILKNPTYCGDVRWNVTKRSSNVIKDESEWIVAKGSHEPIIDEETFKSVQNKINSRNKKRSRPRDVNKHWLSGILKCSNCGKSLVYYESNGRKGFQCWLYGKGKCSVSHYVSEKKAINALIEAFEKVLSEESIEYVVAESPKNKKELKILNEHLNRLTIKEKRIKDAYINEIDTLEEYRINKNMISKERNEILMKMEQFNMQDCSNMKEKMLSRVSDVYDIIISSNYVKEEKSAALSRIVDRIVYDKPNDTFHVHFYFG